MMEGRRREREVGRAAHGGGALRRDGDAGEGVERGTAGRVASAGAMAGGGEEAARSCDVHGGARQEREGRRLLWAADARGEDIGRMRGRGIERGSALLSLAMHECIREWRREGGE